MKKTTLSICFSIFSITALLAQTKPINGETTVTYPTSFSISKPLSQLFDKEEEVPFNGELKDSGDKKNRKAQKYLFSARDGASYGNNEATIQRQQGTRALSAPIANYVGQAGGSCPLDPSGAAGTSHYIQAVNATPFKIFNKANGATVGVVRNIGTLWTPATANAGDPIVMYDKYADRWFISQFGSPRQVYIAISQTNDPTGAYYTYNFTMPAFTDYLKFSIWADGYYMTSNGTEFVNVFERAAMIAGSPTARVLTTNITSPINNFWCPLPGDADGSLPPAGTPCPLVYYTDNGWGGGAIDAIKLHNLTTTWTGTPSLAVSPAITIPVDAFDSSYDTNWADVTQGTGNQKIDAIGGAIMYRSQWRRWTGYDTQLLCWAVKMAAGSYSTKWVELRRDQTTNIWSVYQQGTYAPDNLSRWIASIAMDDNGSIGMSYLTTGKVPVIVNPSLRYTGRLSTDPLGQMTFAEQTAAAGAGASNCGVRVGDYAHTALDPDGITFWHTGHYFNGGSKTKVYSYQITLPLGVAEFQNQSVFTVYQADENLNIKASKLISDKEIVVDIFDVNGKQITGKIIKNDSNSIDTSFDVSNLSSGVYLVRIGNLDFQKVIKTLIK